MFVKVQIYCSGNRCCFEDILNSDKPTIVLNTDHILSIGPKTDWGYCNDYPKYPFRVLEMSNGNSFLCVLESANKLEKLLSPKNFE